MIKNNNAEYFNNMFPTAKAPVNSPWEVGMQPNRSPANAKANINLDQKKGNAKIKTKKGTYEYNASLGDEAYDMSDQIEKLKATHSRNIEKKEEGISDLMRQKMMLLQNSKEQVNLRPIAAFVDAQTGSNFANTYANPTQYKENMAKAQMLEKGIQQQKQDIMKGSMDVDKLELQSKLIQDKTRTNQMQKTLQMALQGMQAGVNMDGSGSAKLKDIPTAIYNQLLTSDEALSMIKTARAKVRNNRDVMGGIWKRGYDFKDLSQMGIDIFGVSANAKRRRIMVAIMKDYVQTIGVAKEKGVLREGDWKKYTDMLGEISSDPDRILAHMEVVEKKILEKKMRILGDYSHTIQGKRGLDKARNTDTKNTVKKSGGMSQADIQKMIDGE